MRHLHRSFCLLLALAVLAGCDSNDPDDDPLEAREGETLVTERVEDLVADPATGRDPDTGAPIATGRYTFFSLQTNEVVLGYDNPDRSDSASTAWDVGFQGTNLIFNGGTSGPGEGAAVIVEEPLEAVEEAPAEEALRVDGQAECPAVFGQPGPPLAVCPGSDNGWYTYNPQTNIITPIPGRTIAVRTADGRFAKVRILSYYQGNPEVPTAEDAARHYTFEYVFQEDGSRDLSAR